MKKSLGKVSQEADGFRVRFERILDHDIQTVWDAITNPEKLKLWFTDIDLEFKPGGKLTIWFRDESKTPSYGKIIKIEPPRIFEFSWENEVAQWELQVEGKNKCKLTLTYSKLSDEYAVSVAAGFHSLLDRLEDMVNGSKESYAFGAEQNDPLQKQLQEDYGRIVYRQFPSIEKYKPIVIEKMLNAPVEKVWQALTNKDQMKKWYFDIPDFKPEVNHHFSFLAGTDEKKWLHLCKITAVEPNSLISYSWRYDGFPGESQVQFELFGEQDKTRLRLTHSGLHTFPADVKDFDKKNFVQGWTEITQLLATFVEG